MYKFSISTRWYAIPLNKTVYMYQFIVIDYILAHTHNIVIHTTKSHMLV